MGRRSMVADGVCGLLQSALVAFVAIRVAPLPLFSSPTIRLTIVGSGFSNDTFAASNHAWVGDNECTVIDHLSSSRYIPTTGVLHGGHHVADGVAHREGGLDHCHHHQT